MKRLKLLASKPKTDNYIFSYCLCSAIFFISKKLRTSIYSVLYKQAKQKLWGLPLKLLMSYLSLLRRER